MKKSTLWILIVLVIVIIVIVLSGNKSDKTPKPGENLVNDPTATVVPVPVADTTKVSAKISRYENAELGFSVQYPLAWEANNSDVGVDFIAPIDKNQVMTVAKLQSTVRVTTGKCAFPPVATIKDRGTITVGKFSLNTISMSNTVQGRNYFDRMYSLQNENVCYMFHFSSITLSPESKGLTGSNITQAKNNNQAIINTADTDFTNMVKSFVFVQGPAGQDETKVAPVKK